ncbi:glycerol-3-phosphate ABC transporter permease [Halobacteriales archaeon QS_1_68_17]|nr:MAG: glycerol-3-phosphate ABC transporter permease [Halobacteriales archaeon QS_1_68_17]
MTLLETLTDAPDRTAEYLRDRPGVADLRDRLREDGLALHALLALSILVLVAPVLVATVVSTKELGIVTSLADLAPGSHAVANYRRALVDLEFGQFMLNSFVMSLAIVVGKLTVSVLAALAIVYYRIPYKNAAFLFVLFTLLLPVPVRFVPLFRLVTDLGWDNTMLAITVPYIASATTVFILRQHFLSIPASLVENAKLDGVGPFEFLWHVLVPMSKGVLVGVSVIMFVYAWNQYLWPLVIINDQSQQVVQVGLGLLRGQAQAGDVAWALVMTGSMLTLLPPLVLLALFRKPLLQTFTIQQK